MTTLDWVYLVWVFSALLNFINALLILRLRREEDMLWTKGDARRRQKLIEGESVGWCRLDRWALQKMSPDVPDGDYYLIPREVKK